MTFALRTCVLASGLLACSGHTIFAGSDVQPKTDPEDAATADATESGPAEIECTRGEADCDGDPGNGCEVDLRHDIDHCGECGSRCADDGFRVGGARCDMGRCLLVCEAPFLADCDGELNNGCETFLWEDDNNCGRCGVRCACHDGRCVGPPPPSN